MNQLIVRAALGVSLFAASLAPAGAQMVPSGSYQQSCIGIHVQNGQLVARCTEPQGDRIRSSIALGSCRGGDIANSNGQLVCNGGNGYRQRGDRNGYGGNNAYGNNGNNSYGNNGNSYGNNGNGYGAPGGSYQQSCSSAHMRGGLLTATCPDGNGTMRTTSIDPRSCRGSDIANRNGRLNCG
jgi:CVNH domain